MGKSGLQRTVHMDQWSKSVVFGQAESLLNILVCILTIEPIYRKYCHCPNSYQTVVLLRKSRANQWLIGGVTETKIVEILLILADLKETAVEIKIGWENSP